MSTQILEDLWLDRDLAWLEFNRRVLAEALDERTPLLERLKFLAIFTSNLDEFFMKRMAVHHAYTHHRTGHRQRSHPGRCARRDHPHDRTAGDVFRLAHAGPGTPWHPNPRLGRSHPAATTRREPVL